MVDMVDSSTKSTPESTDDLEAAVDKPFLGIRLALYKKYKPLNIRNWIQFVKDCGLLTLSTHQAAKVFDTVIESNRKRQRTGDSLYVQVSDSLIKQAQSRAKDHPSPRPQASEERELSLNEFGVCIHRVAHLVYDRKASNACDRFCYLHLLPLAALQDGGYGIISFGSPEVARWRQNKDNKAGLERLFAKFANRGSHLCVKNWQSLLRHLGVFPQHVSLVALQDAFYETIVQCTWEDAVCNSSGRTLAMKSMLNLSVFVEALCRTFLKSTCFKPGDGPGDIVRLLDQFLFPRRFVQRYKRTHTHANEQPGRTEPGWLDDPEEDSTEEEEFAVHPSGTTDRHAVASIHGDIPRGDLRRRFNRRPERRGERKSLAQSEFVKFLKLSLHPNRKKIAQLQLLEFIQSKGKYAFGYPRKTNPSKMKFNRQQGKELDQQCLRLERAIRSYRTQKESEVQEKEVDGTSEGQRKMPLGKTPKGFVSMEEHTVVLSKLQALEDALNIGGLNDLDWDGTLEDAEAKMKDLLPKLMSEDPKEQAEAQEKFEALDKIVRNHKDYKERERLKKEAWEEKNKPLNEQALQELQDIYPKCIAEGTALKDLTELFSLPPALAKRAFQRKVLRMIHMDAGEISKIHIADLTGSFSTQGLDLRELRAVYCKLPDEFQSDGDGRKASWKESVYSQLKSMIDSFESGNLAKSKIVHPAYSGGGGSVGAPATGRRSETKQATKILLKVSNSLHERGKLLAAAMSRRASSPPVEKISLLESEEALDKEVCMDGSAGGKEEDESMQSTALQAGQPRKASHGISPMDALKAALKARRNSLPPEIRPECKEDEEQAGTVKQEVRPRTRSISQLVKTVSTCSLQRAGSYTSVPSSEETSSDELDISVISVASTCLEDDNDDGVGLMTLEVGEKKNQKKVDEKQDGEGEDDEEEEKEVEDDVSQTSKIHARLRRGSSGGSLLSELSAVLELRNNMTST